MSTQTLFTLISASLGFIAAVYFCIGSAFTGKQKLVALSRTYWGFNLEFAKAAVSQSTQYATGGLLLIASFALQVAATQANSTNQITSHPVLGHYLFVVAATLLVVGSLVYCLYSQANKYRMQFVEKELRKELK